MNDLIMLGWAALFAGSAWLLVVLCDRLMGASHERK
jgi:hypothetical protein